MSAAVDAQVAADDARHAQGNTALPFFSEMTMAIERAEMKHMLEHQ